MTDATDSTRPTSDIDPAVAAQLDAADTRESPGEDHGHDTSGPDEMSRVIEADAQRRTGAEGDPLRPESLTDGAEW